MFYNLKDDVKFSTVSIIDRSDNEMYISSQAFMNLFQTNLESIDNIMNFELLSSDVLDVNPILEQEKLMIYIKGYSFND